MHQCAHDLLTLHLRQGARHEGPGCTQGLDWWRKVSSGMIRGEIKYIARNDITGHHDDCPMDNILQLPHVARPGVRPQKIAGGGRDRWYQQTVLERILSHEIVGQRLDVGGPVPQRWNLYWCDIESENRSSRNVCFATSSHRSLLVVA